MPFVKGDEKLTCVDCKHEFTFTDGEKTFYESKGFTDPPKRCKACRDARKADRAAREGGATAQPQGGAMDDNFGNNWNANEGRGSRRSRGRDQ